MFYMKQYFPIYKSGNFFCIGIPDTFQYIEKIFTQELENQVKKLLSEGVNKKEFRKGNIYYELLKKNMLIEFKDYQFYFNNRNRLFFQYMELPQIPVDKLCSKILIFGAGAAGSTIAILLLQFGFKNIIIIDDDKVEQTDVEKTLIFRKEHLNRDKVECIGEIAKENYGIEIKTLFFRPTNKKEILEVIDNYNPDVIVKACDPDLSFRIFLNDICFNKGIPFLHMSYSFERINLGPFYTRENVV
jgi:hypothetical protein